jgi:hypothetical protein
VFISNGAPVVWITQETKSDREKYLCECVEENDDSKTDVETNEYQCISLTVGS